MFIAILGSIPLDPSLTQSLEDGQAFIDLFPNSPTLNAVNNITTKLLQLDIDWDQWCREDFLANLDRNTVFGLAQQDYQQIQIILLPTVYTDHPSGKKWEWRHQQSDIVSTNYKFSLQLTTSREMTCRVMNISYVVNRERLNWLLIVRFLL